MIVEMKSREGIRKQTSKLSPAENAIINETINQFEENNPRRKKITLDMDFIAPLIIKLRELK